MISRCSAPPYLIIEPSQDTSHVALLTRHRVISSADFRPLRPSALGHRAVVEMSTFTPETLKYLLNIEIINKNDNHTLLHKYISAHNCHTQSMDSTKSK